MKNFNTFNLPEILLKNLELIKFNTPTPIQEQSIPYVLEGQDVLGSAQTGTGKTGAYIIPLIAKILKNDPVQALIIAPTRELALQINDACKLLAGKSCPLKTVLLIGGDSIREQMFVLKKQKPQIIVGTPGRLVDLLNRKALNLSSVNYVVLDETDRMLDMGFTVDLEKIISSVQKKRQTLMFSATISDHIEGVAQKYLNNPNRISTGENNVPNQNITENIIKVTNEEDKYKALSKQLSNNVGLKIIFVKTKIATNDLADKLNSDGISATAIHGDLKQQQRFRAIKNFRNGKFNILVATDVIGRGLDIPNISHVINYDLPQCPEDYVHRIGRTGRAGTEGQAINLISPKDYVKWHAICKLTGKKNELAGEKVKKERGDRNKKKRSFGNKKTTSYHTAKTKPKSKNFKSAYRF